MIETLKKIFFLLLVGRWQKLVFLFIAIIVMAVLDMLGVASIFPFLSVISNPEIIQSNSKLKWVYNLFEFSSKDSFLIAIGIASFIILFFNNVLRAVVNLALLKFTWGKRYIISKKLFSYYLYEPYVFFLNRNTSELTAYLASEIARVVSGVLIPCLQVLSRCLLTVLILGFLFVINPIVATVVIVVIGGGYALIYMFARKKLSQAGEDMVKYSKQIFKALNEAFGGIKDIKLLGRENVFIEQYSVPIKKSIDGSCTQFLIAQFPRYAFEVLTFGGILGIAVYIAVIQKNYHQVIPLVGIFAFAAYRLMPALQQIYQDITLIRFSLPALETVYKDYRNCIAIKREEQKSFSKTLPFLKNIELRNIIFKYPNSQKRVIDNLNFIIKSNTTIGFVGGSGAGKTTVVDILLGLLRPQEGEIIVDGVGLNNDNLRMWQKNIGYVSQHIYLCDDTITCNIAFGVPDNEINHQAVKRAAQLANINDFIENELPDGYETEVGERGVRISGGQRQRIGIARALYYNPSLLVFDEATSALDGITENAILEAIHNLFHKKTIIIIAHRFNTVKECDRIYLLDKGKIIDQGVYQELLKNNEKFRKMAQASEKDSGSSQSFVSELG